ncbi:hypothetical protein EYF80_011811 [Liparis tanakae]|uniref:Uncharacterized protein n=1 Tax=Liparis tanakae TaxID=230148 RepID=A0A4Z2IJT7_9TELE|nr:hypothetical protein EYF80_011811 [Liparis tanakae]
MCAPVGEITETQCQARQLIAGWSKHLASRLSTAEVNHRTCKVCINNPSCGQRTTGPQDPVLHPIPTAGPHLLPGHQSAESSLLYLETLQPTLGFGYSYIDNTSLHRDIYTCAP